jgi:hypothetical protein
MKKLGMLVLVATIFVSGCMLKPKIKETKDFLTVPEYKETSKPYVPTVQSSVGDSTYWYVILQEDNGANGKITWHGVVVLPTPYFDFYLARKDFEEAKGESFFENIIQINRESARSFEEYKKIK